MNWITLFPIFLSILESIGVKNHTSIGSIIERTGTYFIGLDGKTRYELQRRMTDVGYRWAFYVEPNNPTGTTAANGNYESKDLALKSFYDLSHSNELTLFINNI